LVERSIGCLDITAGIPDEKTDYVQAKPIVPIVCFLAAVDLALKQVLPVRFHIAKQGSFGMGLLSRITNWSRPSADVLIVADVASKLGIQIASHLDAIEMSYELASSYARVDCPCVHFLDAETLVRCSAKKSATANQLILNVCHHDLENEQLIDRLSKIGKPFLVADNSDTASDLERRGFDLVTTISEGIEPNDFEPAGIDRRLAVRRKMKVPRNAQCVGVFEPLDELDENYLANVVTEMHDQVGPLCLVMFGQKSPMDRTLRSAGISVVRANPRTLGELLSCYWSLVMYINISQIGDFRGILRSWAAGVPVVSRPNAIANDILRDGLTAAVSDSNDATLVAQAAIDLCRDEDFRHGCCERGLVEVYSFAWPKIAERYVNLYAKSLDALAVTQPIESYLAHLKETTYGRKGHIFVW